jgi:hypothetical protein
MKKHYCRHCHHKGEEDCKYPLSLMHKAENKYTGIIYVDYSDSIKFMKKTGVEVHIPSEYSFYIDRDILNKNGDCLYYNK